MLNKRLSEFVHSRVLYSIKLIKNKFRGKLALVPLDKFEETSGGKCPKAARAAPAPLTLNNSILPPTLACKIPAAVDIV